MAFETSYLLYFRRLAAAARFQLLLITRWWS